MLAVCQDNKTPFRPDPETIQKGQALQFHPPLDPGIRDAVVALASGGIETFEDTTKKAGNSVQQVYTCTTRTSPGCPDGKHPKNFV